MKPSFLKKKIMTQFRLVLCCLLALGLGLSVLSYSVIQRLLEKNSQIYTQSTAQKFNFEVEALFDRVDALYSSLLFNENIESMMHNPYSDKTPSYLNALQSQFSSLHLLNPDLVDIGLVTPDMAWSGYFDRNSLKNFSRSMQSTRGTTCFGLQTSSFSKNKDKAEQKLVFGHNVYGMFERTST